MEKLRTAIVGCGKVTDLHAAALKKLETSDFRAVCSRTQEKADAYAAKYQVRGYADLEEMIQAQGIQVLLVLTPHPYHVGPAVTAAAAGVHVLVEKPLASSLIDCDQMIGAAKKAKVKLGTICQRRFASPCQRIRRAIDQGKIGRPILGMVHMLGWRDQAYYESDPWRGKWKEEGGGVLVNQAPHQLDLLQWFMGPIKELYGLWDNLNHPYIEVEDTAVAIMRFQNGALGNILVSNSQNPALFGKVMVHGDNGASIGVQTDGGAMFIAGMTTINEPPLNDVWTVPGEVDMLAQWRQQDTEEFNAHNPTEYYHHKQIEDFLCAVLEDREPLITGEDGRKTVEMFTGLYRSQRDRKPVQFPLQPETDDETFDGRVTA